MKILLSVTQQKMILSLFRLFKFSRMYEVKQQCTERTAFQNNNQDKVPWSPSLFERGFKQFSW
jgi:hypothetical protein